MKAIIWGPTCDSFDQVSASSWLPWGFGTDDWLAWRDMGAYTLAAGAEFNGCPLPAVCTYMTHTTRLLLQRLLEEGAGSRVTAADEMLCADLAHSISQASSGYVSAEDERPVDATAALKKKQRRAA